MWQGVRHGHETLLPWQLLNVFFLKAEKNKRDLQLTYNPASTRLKRR
jgi:hypothetical protein